MQTFRPSVRASTFPCLLASVLLLCCFCSPPPPMDFSTAGPALSPVSSLCLLCDLQCDVLVGA